MCDDINLEQDFESLEMPEVTSCEIPSPMTDSYSHTMEEIDKPSGKNDLFDTHLEISMEESVNPLNPNDIRSDNKSEIGFDDLEKIKKELDDELSISSQDIDHLKEKAHGIERSKDRNEISFKGIKICATRHGCTGATNCDYDLGAPVGR